MSNWQRLSVSLRPPRCLRPPFFCLTVGKTFSGFGQRVVLMMSLSVADDDWKFFSDFTGSDASCADLIRSRLKSALIVPIERPYMDVSGDSGTPK